MELRNENESHGTSIAEDLAVRQITLSRRSPDYHACHFNGYKDRGRTEEEFADRSRNWRVTLELGVAEKVLGRALGGRLLRHHRLTFAIVCWVLLLLIVGAQDLLLRLWGPCRLGGRWRGRWGRRCDHWGFLLGLRPGKTAGHGR